MNQKIFLLTLIVLLTASCSVMFSEEETTPQDLPAQETQPTEPETITENEVEVSPTVEFTASTAGAQDEDFPDDTLQGNIETTYPNVDTGQTNCYNNTSAITCPEVDETFFGQDGSYESAQLSYVDNGDGTITDLNTGLMWMQDAGEKMTYTEALSYAEDFTFSDYADWRLPTIKELYSLMDFSGIDDAVTRTEPFIDTDYFYFEYGDPSIGEREIDSQWVTSSIYESTVMNNQQCFFGVNFADGRIKCYPTGQTGGAEKTYFLRMVRGEEGYGENGFVDNGNGTVTDLSVGLTWQQSDSGEGMEWAEAINYCENLSLAGEEDWRLPNAKELQYIVDYNRSPDTTQSAAINALFDTTIITDELGQTDYGYYWSSTTHETDQGGQNAVYLSFGEAIGQMNRAWMDVHGAGAQRSDPKSSDGYSEFPYSHGPQGDSIRIYNYVRCVTDAEDNSISIVTDTVPTGNATDDPKQTTADAPPEIDFSAAAAQLGVSEQALRQAMGNFENGKPNLAAAAAELGISEQALIEALGLPAGPPEN